MSNALTLTAASAPRNSRGGIDWRNMSRAQVRSVMMTAGRSGDFDTYRAASRANNRLTARVLRSCRSL